MTAKNSMKVDTDARGEGRKDEPAFEKALARLEKIVAEMEAGKMPLEEMISRFEEGQTLIKFCTKKLNEVERRIEILVKKGESAVAEPFDETPASEKEDAASADADRDGPTDLF